MELNCGMDLNQKLPRRKKEQKQKQKQNKKKKAVGKIKRQGIHDDDDDAAAYTKNSKTQALSLFYYTIYLYYTHIPGYAVVVA